MTVLISQSYFYTIIIRPLLSSKKNGALAYQQPSMSIRYEVLSLYRGMCLQSSGWLNWPCCLTISPRGGWFTLSYLNGIEVLSRTFKPTNLNCSLLWHVARRWPTVQISVTNHGHKLYIKLKFLNVKFYFEICNNFLIFFYCNWIEGLFYRTCWHSSFICVFNEYLRWLIAFCVFCRYVS